MLKLFFFLFGTEINENAVLAKRIGARKGLFNSNASASVNIQLIGTIGRGKKKNPKTHKPKMWHPAGTWGHFVDKEIPRDTGEIWFQQEDLGL